MTQLKHSPLRFPLISLIAGVSIPASVFTSAIASHAAVPKAAFVTNMSGSSILLERRGSASQSAAAWRTQLRDYRENLFVPRGTTSHATLTGISAPPGVAVTSKHLIGPTAYVRSQTLDVRYRFPCTVSGEGLLGWRPSQERDDRGCVPPGVRIRSGQSGGSAFLPLQAPTLATKQLLKAQRLPDFLLSLVRVQYCSAIGDSGTGWGVSSSDSMGLLGAGDPCEKALKDCLQSSSGDDCSVASTWEWKASERELMVSLDCDNNRKFNAKGSGWAIASTLLLRLKETANAIGAKSCTFDVYAPGEMIVAPATNQLTLVQFRRSGSRLIIDAIRGDVVVKSAEDPDGRTLSQGSSYSAGSYDGDRYFPARQPIQRLSATQLSESPVVRSFLATSPTVSDTNLSQDVVDEIGDQNKAFQEVLRQALSSN